MSTFEHKPNQGSIWKNDYKEQGDNKPEYKGQVNVDGKLYEISLWINTTESGKKYFGARLSEPYVKPEPSEGEEQPQAESDDIPF